MSQIKKSNLNSITVPHIIAMKSVREKITMLTAYDYPTAALVDKAGVEMILVGDSVGTVVYGYESTIPVTMDQMLMHVKAVTSGAKRSLVVADMPFMSYQASDEDALRNAGRFLKKSGAHAIKLEGGLEVKEKIRKLTQIGIPVMAHIGLMPQSIRAMGRYRTFGKTKDEAKYLLESARCLEDAGAFAIVLECVEHGLAESISKALSIPTIGIGSGAACDGQVLVFHDLVGMTPGHVPSFVRPEADAKSVLLNAVGRYIERTKNPNALTRPEPRIIIEGENAPSN